jgi:hypothetical protein
MPRYKLTPLFAFHCEDTECTSHTLDTWIAANDLARAGRPCCPDCTKKLVLRDPSITIATALHSVGQCLPTHTVSYIDATPIN